MENIYKDRAPIHPKCKGCGRIVSHAGTDYCSAYIKPSVFWKRGGCALATHVVINSDASISQKERVGQQKQKKKAKKK